MTQFTIAEDFPESKIEFEQRFSNERACQQFLAKMKWPYGFVCRKCGHRRYWVSARDLYICTRCETPHSLAAGTVMHATRKSLVYWFKAMWWFTTRKSGVNAVNLKDLVASLAKRLILGTFQSRFAPKHLQSYMDATSALWITRNFFKLLYQIYNFYRITCQLITRNYSFNYTLMDSA